MLVSLGSEATFFEMENGNGVVGGYVEEKKPVEDRVPEEKAEEKVLEGSDGSKDVEEELFEEAVGTQEHFPEEGPKPESGGGGSFFGNSGSVRADKNFIAGNETDDIKKAFGFQGEAGSGEEAAVVSIEGQVGDSVGVESADGVQVLDKFDDEGTEVEAAADELSGGKEAAEGDEYMDFSKGGDEVIVKSDVVVEKANGAKLPDKIDETEAEIQATADELSGPKEVNDVGVNGDVGASKGEDKEVVKYCVEVEKPDRVEVPDKIDEGGTEMEAAMVELNGGKEESEVGISGDIEVSKGGDEAFIKSAVGNRKYEDVESVNLGNRSVNENTENGDADRVTGSGHESHGETELSGNSFLEDKKSEESKEDILCNERGDGSANESVDFCTRLEHQGDGGKEVNENLAKGEVEPNGIRGDADNKGAEVMRTLDSSTTEHQESGNGALRYTSAEPQTYVKEEGAIIGTLHSLEKSATEVQAGATELKLENNKSSLPVQMDEKVNEVQNGHAVLAKPEKKAEKELENKPITQVNRECKNLSTPANASSSAKSTNHAPPSRPAGLGRAAPLLEPAPRVVQQPRANGGVSHPQIQQIEDPANVEADENDETREKLQMIRVKFLRLAHRLGQTPHNVVVAQVLYRLGLAEQLRGRNGGRVGAFSFDRASALAEQLEAAGHEPLDFSCTIMVLGKTGVGKSATINSIFDEVKFSTDAFQTGTKKVQDVVGTVQGIRVRVIDTPGLLPSWSDQHQNEKILHSVKRFIKKTPPDIVLYLDRLDMQSRDFSDMPLLRTITEIFGPSIWFNAIVVLTHAASAPPDGPNGTASSYDMFVTQRSHVVQQAIRQAAGDMRLMNPVSLVENHSACRTNRAGQRVLPNGQVWKPHLLLLSFASKILAEANALLKLQDSPPGKPFAARSRAPPLPFLLSTLLQSRPQVKLPEEQFSDEDDIDDDLDESSDSDEESEYDRLPPFKRLTKAQMAKLSKAQVKEYLNELEYREKLFMKKQLKEEKRRRKIMKQMAAATKDLPTDFGDNVEEGSSGAASVPVPMPDLALPASFDSDNPTHRYRYLDSSQWLVRPVLETHGWDHDVGYEGINVERLFVVKEKVPISFSGQVTKDKKDANIQMELASSIKHGEGKATSVGFDMQTVGKDLAYTLRSEMRFCNFRKNKATAGLSVTLLGDALSAGVKFEDKLVANKRFRLVMTGGAITGRGDVAYGGSLEAQLRDKDYPLGRFLSTIGLSIMDWHGDLAIGGNVQCQLPVGRSTNLIARANLNNRGAGQVGLRLNSSEQLQIALIGFLPLFKKLLGYPQQMQYGQ